MPIPTLQRKTGSVTVGVYVHFKLPQHMHNPIFLDLFRARKRRGKYQQQELLSKLMIFCTQDDGRSGSDFIFNRNL